MKKIITIRIIFFIVLLVSFSIFIKKEIEIANYRNNCRNSFFKMEIEDIQNVYIKNGNNDIDISKSNIDISQDYILLESWMIRNLLLSFSDWEQYTPNHPSFFERYSLVFRCKNEDIILDINLKRDFNDVFIFTKFGYYKSRVLYEWLMEIKKYSNLK